MNTNDSGTGSKKSWDDWSDFEINKSIASIVIGGSNFTEGVEGCVMCYSLSGWCIANPNYCNNPADMWPIIVDNSITINYDTCQAHVSSYFNEAIKISVSRNMVLRAAAIVFLMMNGVNPE